MEKLGRNDPCSCGSGRKYKLCCAQSARSPSSVRANPALEREALLHYRAGHFMQAEFLYQQVLAVEPDNTEALHRLGIIATEMGRLEIAFNLIRRAISIAPDNPYYHGSLGNVFKARNEMQRAADAYRRALALKPDLPEACNNLATVLRELGHWQEAIPYYEKALARGTPAAAMIYSNLLFLCGSRALTSPEEYLERARGWDLACVAPRERQAARRRVLRRAPLAGRRLRVGYLSGDFRDHPVSYFMEPVLQHHDRERIELFAYSTHPREDEITRRLRNLVEHWVPYARAEERVLRERIAADAIDVLVDLSGHTVDNRIDVVARRVAPVQAHYLGFFASTGLTEMDYWIGDEWLTLVETDAHFSESVWRLPRVSVAYAGRMDAPRTLWRPADDGTVWLGSFNTLAKITPETLALWSRVLHALPEAKLLLKNKQLGEQANRRRVLEGFGEHGINPARIDLRDVSATRDWLEHMAYYDRLDIALDPIGSWNGNTTTCEALWMGVPVIAMLGDRAALRMTAPMLNALGHSEWIARAEQEYIDKIVNLARDVGLRATLRPAQRDRLIHSELGDARDLTEKLEQAYFAMYERWLSR